MVSPEQKLDEMPDLNRAKLEKSRAQFLAKAMEQFYIYDRNNDGSFNRDDVIETMKGAGVTPTDAFKAEVEGIFD